MSRVTALLLPLVLLLGAPACRKCPESCDDGDICTADDCSKETGFECRHVVAHPCAGNRVCEQGEYGVSSDCPDCGDNDPCTADAYDFRTNACTHDPIVPCCGNGKCEPTEGLYSCVADCRDGMKKLVAGREYTLRMKEKYQFELRQLELSAIWDGSIVADVTQDTQRIGLRIDRGTTGTVLGVAIRVDTVDFDLDPENRSARLRVFRAGAAFSPSPVTRTVTEEEEKFADDESAPTAIALEPPAARLPVIADLTLTPEPGGARVSWNLNEDADGIVNWGTTPAYGDHISDFAFTRRHEILVPLAPGAYYLAVRSCLYASPGVCTETKNLRLSVAGR